MTEEAAKTALVMPFIQALGYDVFNPSEVVPEFIADVGTKKGEKVDYAICSGKDVFILIECKPVSADLNINHAGQLYRYFSVTEARLAILTNGVVYQFYTDSDHPNKMDQKPFFVCNLESLKPNDAKTLEKFVKGSFDIAQIVAEASALKLRSLIRIALEAEFYEPSDEFVRLIASKTHEGSITRPVREAVARQLPSSVAEIIRDMVTQRLNSALEAAKPVKEPESLIEEDQQEFETTHDEIAGWRIVQAIAAKHVHPSRIVIRDQKSYCAVLLDDNNRKALARLHFNSEKTRYVGTFNGKEETRHQISDVSDIYSLSGLIEARVLELSQKVA